MEDLDYDKLFRTATNSTFDKKSGKDVAYMRNLRKFVESNQDQLRDSTPAAIALKWYRSKEYDDRFSEEDEKDQDQPKAKPAAAAAAAAAAPPPAAPAPAPAAKEGPVGVKPAERPAEAEPAAPAASGSTDFGERVQTPRTQTKAPEEAGKASATTPKPRATSLRPQTAGSPKVEKREPETKNDILADLNKRYALALQDPTNTRAYDDFQQGYTSLRDRLAAYNERIKRRDTAPEIIKSELGFSQQDNLRSIANQMGMMKERLKVERSGVPGISRDEVRPVNIGDVEQLYGSLDLAPDYVKYGINPRTGGQLTRGDMVRMSGITARNGKPVAPDVTGRRISYGGDTFPRAVEDRVSETSTRRKKGPRGKL